MSDEPSVLERVGIWFKYHPTRCWGLVLRHDFEDEFTMTGHDTKTCRRCGLFTVLLRGPEDE